MNWRVYRPNKGARGASGSGTPGPDGKSAYQVALDNGFVGSEAAWLASLHGEDGANGTNGTNGVAATIGIASVTTGAPGSGASVTNVGTQSAASLAFTIPRGDGGSPGAAATVAVNSVTTLVPGSSATVTNVGTSAAALLNFGIPRGDQGLPGPSKRIVTATLTTNASGVASLVYSPAFASTPNVHCELTVPANNRQMVRLTASSATGCSIIVEQRTAVLLSLLGIDILAAGVTLVNGAMVRITVFEV